MDAQTLYDELAGEAWKLAGKSSLDVEDIRQELFLLCLEVAEGRSTYTPVIGGVHGYIMGRLWGLVRRWPCSCSIEVLTGNISEKLGSDENGDVLAEFIPVTLHAPSVEDVLEQRDALFGQDAVDIEEIHLMRERLRNHSTLSILIQSGVWTIRDAAAFCGVNHLKIWRNFKKTKHMVELV